MVGKSQNRDGTDSGTRGKNVYSIKCQLRGCGLDGAAGWVMKTSYLSVRLPGNPAAGLVRLISSPVVPRRPDSRSNFSASKRAPVVNCTVQEATAHASVVNCTVQEATARPSVVNCTVQEVTARPSVVNCTVQKVTARPSVVNCTVQKATARPSVVNCTVQEATARPSVINCTVQMTTSTHQPVGVTLLYEDIKMGRWQPFRRSQPKMGKPKLSPRTRRPRLCATYAAPNPCPSQN